MILSRVLEFPAGNTTCTLSFWNPDAERWTDLGPASGSVRVPVGRRIAFYAGWGADPSLDVLSRLPGDSTHALLFGHSGIRDDDLSAIAHLTSVEVLSLRYTGITGAGFKHLTGWTKLRELDLTGTPLDDTGARALATFTGLEELRLLHTCITDEGLRHLASHITLRALDLSVTRATDTGLRALASLPLEDLDLGSVCVTD